MLKKFDLDRVKEFFFAHGEKVALGTCVFLALIIGALGLFRAFGFGKSEKTGLAWNEELKREHDLILSKINGAPVEKIDAETEKKLKEHYYYWPDHNLKHQSTPYLPVSEGAGGNKRENPKPLTIKRGPKDIQLHYVRGLVLAHKYGESDKGGKYVKVMVDEKAKKIDNVGLVGRPEYLYAAQPRRMVVVTAVFPMALQVEEYVRALKMKNQKELFDSPDDLPKPLGFNVRRFELGSDGLPLKADGDILFNYDPTQKEENRLMIAEPLRELLREAEYDERTPDMMKQYIFAGLTTPLPKLAYGRFPRFQLEGIDVAWEDDVEPKKPAMGGGPMNGGGGPETPKKKGLLPGDPRIKQPMPEPKAGNNPEPARRAEDMYLKQLNEVDPRLSERLLFNSFNPYHALGLFAPAKANVKNAAGNPNPLGDDAFFSAWKVKVEGDEKPGNQPMGGRPKQPVNPMPGGNEPAFPDWKRDAILRFVDPDVKPGKKYAYAIQVRLANPNFKKNALVAFDALAGKEELPLHARDSWVTTPSITIPHEYFLYAVDQQSFDGGSSDKKTDLRAIRDTTTFQIHQWVKKRADFANANSEFVIGDWAIAERLSVRRGGAIGTEAIVQVPVWNEMRSGFEVPFQVEVKDPKDPRRTLKRPGFMLEMKPPADPQGKAGVPEVGEPAELPPPILIDFYGGKRLNAKNAVEEETAVDALILHADGRLEVVNSRDHSDLSNPIGQERQDRVRSARARVEEYLGPGDNPNRPPLPGGMK